MDEAHTLSAMRYVEQNSVRSNLVKYANEWNWSSAPTHLGQCRDDMVVQSSLAERIGNWADFLSIKPSESRLNSLRTSTNKGISILQTAYASESTAKTLKLSPNPFKIPSEEFLSIWQIASGSVVRIMTLNGYVLKTFHLSENQNRINNWDGRKDSGDFVTSGIYLISASHSDGFNAIGKLAVIRQ